MSAVFPILKRDGSAYANLTEFKQDLNHSTSGRYILSAGHGWHGGVHLNSQSFPWGKGLRSIQAMLGGKVAAYRINDDYVSSEYMGKTFKFSNNFVLLEHEYADPTEGSDKVFTFYTLYMHLAPPKHIAANAEHHSRYRIEDAKGINTRVLENGQFKSPVALPTGSEFEYLDVDNKTFKTAKIGSTEYAMIRCRVLSDTSGSQTLLNKEVWIASGKHEEADFALLTQSGYIVPVPSPEPAWMTGSEIKRDGSVVAIKKPDGEDTRINIDAGSDLGYLSLNEFSQDSNATKQDEYVVHIEMFSLDKPEEYFLKQFENINQTPIDGTVSDGAVKPGNPLFSQLVTLTSEEADSTLAPTTTEALITRLNGKREKLEKLIVQHQSEWCQDSANTHLDSIKESAKEVLDRLFESSFISRDEYKDSKWHNKLEDVYQSFFTQQQEKAKLLTWIQDASAIVTKDAGLYYFWPFSVKNIHKLIWMKLVIDRFGDKIADQFKYKVIKVGKELGIDPNYIMACIALETGREFDPSTKNPKSTATGLIQFMESTAKKDLKTTTEKLSKMTHVEQMDYVKKFFQLQAKYQKVPTNMWTLEDVYYAIFTPKLIKKNNEYVVYKKGSKEYRDNIYHDINKDGELTKKEIAKNINKYYELGFKYEA